MSEAERNKNSKYNKIPLKEIHDIRLDFIKRFIDFIPLKGFPEDTEIHISHYSLLDIIIRVDKRKAYYQFFHNMEINEWKEAALYAYWILKLRPFTIIDKRFTTNVDACLINESFAIYFIGFILEKTGRIKHSSKYNESYRRFLEYSFRYRNFSIDSFVVLIESITTETLEQEYPDLSHYSS